MHIAIAFNESDLIWGKQDQPLGDFYHISLKEDLETKLAQLEKELCRYPFACLTLYLCHGQQETMVRAIPRLSPQERRKVTQYHERVFAEGKVFWGSVTQDVGKGQELLLFGLTSTPLLDKILGFLKKIPQPIVNTYSLTFQACQHALNHYLREVAASEQSQWRVVFIHIPLLSPQLILMRDTQPILTKTIADPHCLERELDALFRHGQAQGGVYAPSLVTYGFFPHTNHVLPWHHSFSCKTGVSLQGGMPFFAFAGSPFAKDRFFWRTYQVMKTLSLVVGLVLTFFSGAYSLLDHKMQCQQLYWQSQPRLEEEVQVPQGFHAQKMILTLHDKVQPWCFSCLWRTLKEAAYVLPPLQQLTVVKESGRAIVGMTTEIPVDVEATLSALRAIPRMESAALIEPPAFMDMTQSYAVTMQGEERQKTVTFSFESSVE